MSNKVLLTILDGWGEDFTHKEYNAIEVGNTPNWHRILKTNPNATLVTFGNDVGLPEGQMGNSEVGHTNIGAGRVVFQELPRINNAIKDGSFDQNMEILKTLQALQQEKSSIHIMGLFSDGGVHSHINHLLHTIELFAKNGVHVYLHLFTDGRDTPPQSAISYLPKLKILLSKYPNIQVATLCGRYYAMDRDNRWERIELAYNAMVSGAAPTVSDVNEAITNAYKADINDEFIKPVVIAGYQGMKDGESIFMINFRTDRVRQILNALLLKDFQSFQRKKLVSLKHVLGMSQYSDVLKDYVRVIFPPQNLKNTLGEWLELKHLKQLRIAETEKYPHVTFFFSGGREKPFNGEDRILVPSPKVATYDLKPEMSAYEITTKLEKALQENVYDFIVVNYANGDMVGHTGVLQAAAKATEAVDKCLLSLEKVVKANNYNWLIIADHGNCETMWDFKNNVPHTQHTTNLVRIILANSNNGSLTLNNGKLADIAPTVLELMAVAIPEEMNGKSLLKK